MNQQDAGSHAGRSAVLEGFAARAFAERRDGTREVDAAAAEVFAAFERAGARALLLKGPALARLLYRPVERRTYVDLDVLIAPADRGAACHALLAAGYVTSADLLGIDDVGQVVHAETWTGIPRSAMHEVAVDVHYWLPGATIDAEQAWPRLATGHGSIEIGGLSVPVPGRPCLAMHIAMHCAQHGPDYAKGMRDLELALERWDADVWRAACELATDVGAVATFAAGLRLSTAGAELARALELPSSTGSDWEIRNRHARPRGAFHLDALVESRGAGQRISIVRRALIPKRQWIITAYPWAYGSRLRLAAGYGAHVVRAPYWCLLALRFRRRRSRQQ